MTNGTRLNPEHIFLYKDPLAFQLANEEMRCPAGACREDLCKRSDFRPTNQSAPSTSCSLTARTYNIIRESAVYIVYLRALAANLGPKTGYLLSHLCG